MSNYKIREITEYISRGITPSYSDNGIVILNQKCIRGNKVNLDRAQYTDSGKHYNKDKYVKKGDILINSTGAGTLGRVGFYSDTKSCLCDSHISIVRCKKNTNDGLRICAKYIDYYLHYNEATIESFGKGSTSQTELSGKDVGKIDIDIPAYEIQIQVTRVLENYDSLIEANNKRIKVLEQMAENLYKEWFVRFRFPGHETVEFENGIPKEWAIKRMSDFCYVTDGTHDTPAKAAEGVPLVTGKCIQEGKINFDEAYLISIYDHEKIKQRSGLQTGDILFSNIGTVGKTCIVNYDREFSTKNVIIFKPDNVVKGLYLYYWLISKPIQEVFATQTNGASQQFVGLTFMRKYKLLVPEYEILERFSDNVGKIVEEIQKYNKINDNLIVQRNLLLPRLMSGKLEV